MTRTALFLLLLALIGAVSSIEFPESFPDSFPDFLEKRESPPRTTCRANGKTYEEGESFKMRCNTCTCVNGRAACTLMRCNGCTHQGKYYEKNDRFALSLNTTCACLGQDRIGCQTMPNPTPNQCYFDGKFYDAKVKFRKGCNFCGCIGFNVVYCSRLDCSKPKLGCTHNGRTYRNGQSFFDRCNHCVCSSRVLVCSQLTCL